MSEEVHEASSQAAPPAAAQEPPVCRNCLWWTATSPPRGQCRRYPPSHVPWHRTINELGVFPATLEDYWCGEHPVLTRR